jgi:hypothetical protein
MGTSIDADATTVERRQARGRTTIALEATRDGGWRATQDGVDVVGRGETAALAAADYCRRVEEADE